MNYKIIQNNDLTKNIHKKYNGNIDPCQVPGKYETPMNIRAFLMYELPHKIILQKNAFFGMYMLL